MHHEIAIACYNFANYMINLYRCKYYTDCMLLQAKQLRLFINIITSAIYIPTIDTIAQHVLSCLIVPATDELLIAHEEIDKLSS